MSKKLILILIFAIVSILNSFGQGKDIWYAFSNESTNLIGFKDKNGVVKIQPKFNEMTSVIKFDNIIAVIEDTIGKGNSYYLTKTGKIVGKNSLYYYDNTNDCESEGFIRFRDHKSSKVGMLNRTGTVVIPAIYDDLSVVQNGLIIGLKGAEKKFFNIDKYKNSEDYYWDGGQQILMDTLNNTLVENCTTNQFLNLYSLKKTNTPDLDPIRVAFLGKDGSYYSFIDYEKEFKQWITNTIEKGVTLETLMDSAFETITWDTKKSWGKTKKEKLITDNFTLLKNNLFEIVQPSTEYFISSDGLNSITYDGKAFEKYFNNCGASKEWKYPKMSLNINHYDNKKLVQNSYGFLRTDEGYQLINLSFHSDELK